MKLTFMISRRERESFSFFAVRCVLASLMFTYLMTGCSSVPPPAPQLVPKSEMGSIPPVFKSKIDKLAKEKDRNSVLNLTDIAVTGLKHQKSLTPHQRKIYIDKALDLAIKRIEDVYANTKEAKKALSYWHDEKSKPFKGEPYERSFVFLLRGLRYYAEGELDNAIACFKSGSLQDSLSVEGKFNADMATFDWLEGVCHMRQGDMADANTAFARAYSLRPDLARPGKNDNLLVVALTGTSPKKNRTGKYQDILWIEPGQEDLDELDFTRPHYGALPKFKVVPITDDMYHQATTRGDREIDKVNKYKAKVKNTTQVVGWAFLVGGAIALGIALMMQGGSSTMLLIIGASLIAAGITTHLIALAIKTKADIRYVDSVPSNIRARSCEYLPGRMLLPLKLLKNNDDAGDGGVATTFIKGVVNPKKLNNIMLIFQEELDGAKSVPQPEKK